MVKNPDPMAKLIADAPKPRVIDDMPLTTYEEYKAYNEAARKENRRLRICRYPCKPCPEALHPHDRIKFGRIDQPDNALPIRVSNHLIDFEKMVYPGKTYDLPRIIVNHLVEKGVPHWIVQKNPDGTVTPIISHDDPRFSISSIFKKE